MQTFADYLLEEQEMSAKVEIVYYLSKKNNMFFDKSVVFKTEILREFLNYSKIEVDRNLIYTISLLCNCKKIDNAQDLESIHTYAKRGSEYLEELGFDKRACKIAEEINRYSNSNPREKESDILELIDIFGGMLLDRPERIGFKPDEALVLLEHRNLKDCYNRYLEIFIEFVNFMEEIEMGEFTSMSSLRRLVKTYNDETELINFIKKVIYKYQPKIDKLMEEQFGKEKEEMFSKVENPNRALFSPETAKKILEHANERRIITDKN